MSQFSSPLHAAPAQERTRSGEEGFYLVEIIIGMVVAVIVIGAALSMTIQLAKQRKIDQETHLALVACRNNIEEIRSIPFADLPALNGAGFDVQSKDGAPGGLNALPGDPDGLPGQLTVTVDQTIGSENIYLVRATVTWTGTLRRQSFNMETLIGPRE